MSTARFTVKPHCGLTLPSSGRLPACFARFQSPLMSTVRPSRMTHLVFVFGTLKEGFPNFATNRGVRVPGAFTTKYRYPPLCILSSKFSINA